MGFKVVDENGNGPRGPEFHWNKKYNKYIYILAIIAIVVIGAIVAFNLVTDYIWMDSLGFSGVFTTILKSKILLGLSGFILFFLMTFITTYWIRRAYLSYLPANQIPKIIKQKRAILIITGIAILVGLFGSNISQEFGWERALKFLNHASFDKTDPFFHLDISFYMFVLPFVKFTINMLLGVAILFLIVEMGAYSVFQMYKKSKIAKIHLAVTAAIVGILIAGTHALAPFNALMTDHVNTFQDSVVYGLSYTDKLINIPKSYILAAVVLIITVWLIIGIFRGRIQKIATPVIVYIAIIIVGQVSSAVVQNFIVSPNEFSKEQPFLQENLDYTRSAYRLDDIDTKQNPGNDSLSRDMIERNDKTISNIRMNDSRPLLTVYNQLQTFRPYYEFNNVDIDRYMVDGQYQQVFLGARELNTSDLPEQAHTWVNQNLRYTHGYGVAMSHVNQVTTEGQPKYMVKNLPPDGVVDVDRPQIYFGEEPYGNVIVNSNVAEFDYPSGSDNVDNHFDSDTGIYMKGLNRLLFAINEGSFRMFVSDQITEESQLLMTRNIMDRVNRIAPFLEYDDDPYIVVRDDGSLVWMIDAYVLGERYPYSEPFKGDYNYIRNPIKVSVDAYTGEVHFYLVNEDEKIAQTYKQIFPDLLETDIPDDIRAHFRYPVTLFTIQAEKYRTYHMSNLEVFYNREDFWQFPTEKYFNEDTVMDPYYMTMRLPEEDQEEFVLMLPYTPKKRQNMISWVGVRNDGDNYGDIFVYRFPKQRNIYGPQQIENRINQNSKISKQLNLWSQGGSNVIRGNLLTVPIEDTVLYVEPIYLKSSNQTSLPEVKRVVIAYEDHIIMERSFDEALEKMLDVIDPNKDVTDDIDESDNLTDDGSDENIDEETNDDTDSSIDENDNGQVESTPWPDDAEERLNEFADKFKAYKDALSDGEFEKAGKILEEIEDELNSSDK